MAKPEKPPNNGSNKCSHLYGFVIYFVEWKLNICECILHKIFPAKSIHKKHKKHELAWNTWKSQKPQKHNVIVVPSHSIFLFVQTVYEYFVIKLNAHVFNAIQAFFAYFLHMIVWQWWGNEDNELIQVMKVLLDAILYFQLHLYELNPEHSKDFTLLFTCDLLK